MMKTHGSETTTQTETGTEAVAHWEHVVQHETPKRAAVSWLKSIVWFSTFTRNHLSRATTTAGGVQVDTAAQPSPFTAQQ